MAQIAILGLNMVGMSLGLALRKAEPPPTIVGADRDGSTARRAQQIGAVDRTEGVAANACRNAALVILNESFSLLRDLLESIAPSLSPGCVVTCTAPLMAPVLAWAEELLPEGVSFVSGHPILSPVKPGNEPSAELFQRAQYCIVPSDKATSEAMSLVSGLATSMGAQPFFLDAAEHDGLMTAVEGLPELLGVALMSAAASASSWRDMRRIAGPALARATTSVDVEPADTLAALRANRENVARWLEMYSATLDDVRAMLLAEDAEPLTKMFTQAREARDRWLSDYQSGNWDNVAEMPKISMGSMLSNLVWPQRQLPEDKKRKK